MTIVTLLSDFGTADGYVGAMKGVVSTLAPAAALVDIAHDIPRHDVAAGAFALAQAAAQFPAGTIHLAVVDPGVGGSRRAVVIGARGQLFVGPDNGLFSWAAPPPRQVFAIENPGFRAAAPSTTFHGRDLFAVAAGRLAAGAAAAEVGPPVELSGELPIPTGGDGASACVVHVDAFGNLITDFPAARVPASARFRVAGRDISGLGATYEAVARGELVAYLGSGGTLEIAVREGSAAEVLAVGRGARVEIGPAPAPGREPP